MDNDQPIDAWILAAFQRSAKALNNAEALADSGFYGPAYVWGVRAAEITVRDFVLAPHFYLGAADWTESLRHAGQVLGNSNWRRAFDRAEEWWGPFKVPLIEDDRHAWDVWASTAVRRRDDIAHGRLVASSTEDEARQVAAFVRRMIEWYREQFIASPRHPLGQRVRYLLDRTQGEAAK